MPLLDLSAPYDVSGLTAPAGDPNWRLVDSPDRPKCVPPDGDVPVYTTEMGVRYVRTPDTRFANLPGFPFAPHYTTIDGLRMHYVDEGPQNGDILLLLHGQPTWSYLYRKMIPPIASAGYRVVAVDCVGMGRSDKPVEIGYHTFEQHVRNLKTFIAALGLRDITLFCQDWGSLIGLRTAGDSLNLFARIVVANGNLPVIPKGANPFRVPNPVEIDCSLGDFQMSRGLNPSTWQIWFQRWIIYTLTAPNLTASQVVAALAAHALTAGEKAAYDAPYPSFIYKAAPRAFPSMGAAIEEQNMSAWNALGTYRKPFLFQAGELDQNMGSVQNQLRWIAHVPGAQWQPHERFPDAGHYIQDDIGPLLATKVLHFMSANPIHAVA